MSGYLLTQLKNECFGCGACFQACPAHAIQMMKDFEGFLYPSIVSEKCVKCNLCHRVCPTEQLLDKNAPKQALAGFSIDGAIRHHSESGGAFKAIIDSADDKANIYGVEWDSRSSVSHHFSDKLEAYTRFSKSKYIQSNTGQTYRTVKGELNDGKEVVYTGTPCQIAGLKSYLGKEYANLLCVDLVCHGVPSSDVLERYLKSVEKKSNPVVRINFREKVKRNETIDSKCAVIVFSNGKQKVVDYDSSGFLRGFANGLFFRPSCATCPFACGSRISDLTIGDAWGIEHFSADLNPHEGVSLILVNTEKGLQWIDRIKMTMSLQSYDVSQMVSGNGRLKSPDKGHAKRDVFFSRFQDEDFEKLIQELIPRVSCVRKIAHTIKTLVSK